MGQSGPSVYVGDTAPGDVPKRQPDALNIDNMVLGKATPQASASSMLRVADSGTLCCFQYWQVSEKILQASSR